MNARKNGVKVFEIENKLRTNINFWLKFMKESKHTNEINKFSRLGMMCTYNYREEGEGPNIKFF